MIGIGQATVNQKESDDAGITRRRRTPSKYAESIRELAKVLFCIYADDWKNIKKGKKLVL